MRIPAAILLMVALSAAPTQSQTRGFPGFNELSINAQTVFVPPCARLDIPDSFLNFTVLGSLFSTAAVLFIDPCPTSCGLVQFDPCYSTFGVPVNSLDIGSCALLSLPLAPAGSGVFSSGPIFNVPEGLEFSVQGVVLDPFCVARGFHFTQAYDVKTVP